MDLTVGLLEDKLRQYPKGTPIHVSCGVCHHGALGSENIISVEDKTKQTYGYIELNLNTTSKPKVELSEDKEKFYKAEIEKLNKIIENQEIALLRHKHAAESIKSSCDWILK